VLNLTDCRKVFRGDQYIEWFSPQGILQEYKAILSSKLPQDKYLISFEEVDQKLNNPKKQMAMAASRLNATYIFMGGLGRKGDKDDEYMVGRTCTEMVVTSKIPVAIVGFFFILRSSVSSKERRTCPKGSASPV